MLLENESFVYVEYCRNSRTVTHLCRHTFERLWATRCISIYIENLFGYTTHTHIYIFIHAYISRNSCEIDSASSCNSATTRKSEEKVAASKKRNAEEVKFQQHGPPVNHKRMLTMCTKKESPVVDLPRGRGTDKRFMLVPTLTTEHEELQYFDHVSNDCVTNGHYSFQLSRISIPAILELINTLSLREIIQDALFSALYIYFHN